LEVSLGAMKNFKVLLKAVNRKYILIVLALFIIAGSGFFIYQNSRPTSIKDSFFKAETRDTNTKVNEE